LAAHEKRVAQSTVNTQQARIERSLKRLGFQLGKGRGRAFTVMAAGGGMAPNATDTMTLDQVECWISDHIKPKR
jgi:hypothetical protein